MVEWSWIFHLLRYFRVTYTWRFISMTYGCDCCRFCNSRGHKGGERWKILGMESRSWRRRRCKTSGIVGPIVGWHWATWPPRMGSQLRRLGALSTGSHGNMFRIGRSVIPLNFVHIARSGLNELLNHWITSRAWSFEIFFSWPLNILARSPILVSARHKAERERKD